MSLLTKVKILVVAEIIVVLLLNGWVAYLAQQADNDEFQLWITVALLCDALIARDWYRLKKLLS